MSSSPKGLFMLDFYTSSSIGINVSNMGDGTNLVMFTGGNPVRDEVLVSALLTHSVLTIY